MTPAGARPPPTSADDLQGASDGAALADTRRRQILDAAARVFARRGFHAASMAEIAKCFGMSAGHIYNHFESKEAIVEAIVERDLEAAQQVFAELRAEPDLQRAIVDRVTSDIESRLDEEHAALKLEVLAEASRNPRVAEMVRRVDAALRKELISLLAAARRQGDGAASGDNDADDAARSELMMALFEGFPSRALRHPSLDREGLVRALRQAVQQLVVR